MVALPAASLLLVVALTRCADAQVDSFVCYMSFDDFGGYRMVSPQQVCNGVNECPEGEDEVGCNGEGGLLYAATGATGDQVQQIFNTAAAGFPVMSPGDWPDAPAAAAAAEEMGERGVMLSPPSGFVRLPDKLQQKEYYNGVQGKKGFMPSYELRSIRR